MKKWILSILSMFVLSGSIASAATTNNVQIACFKIGDGHYSVNGLTKEDVAPYIKDGHTFLPLRYCAYAMGIGDNSIYWDPNNQTVYMMKNNKLLVVPVGSNTVTYDGESIAIDPPAEIANGRCMLPLRAIGDIFGCQVQWDGQKQLVTIIANN